MDARVTAAAPPKLSTIALFDATGCDPHFVRDPVALQLMMMEIVRSHGLTVREENIDAYEGGGGTQFFTLAESHARTTGLFSSDFGRSESWPEEDDHINGEIQICNFSRDNSHLPRLIALQTGVRLKAKVFELTVIQRGPVARQKIIEGPKLLQPSTGTEIPDLTHVHPIRRQRALRV